MGKNAKGFEFRKFATPRIIGGIAIVIIILWALSIIFGTPQGPTSEDTAVHQLDSATTTSPTGNDGQGKTTLVEYSSSAARAAKNHSGTMVDTTGQDTPIVHGTTTAVGAATQEASEATGQGATTHSKTTVQQAGSHGTTTADQPTTHGRSAKAHGSAATQVPQAHLKPVAATEFSAQASGHGAAVQTKAPHGTSTGHAMPATDSNTMAHKPKPKGVAFVGAIIKPLQHELEERWWGWRPNDIIEFTDNVNTYQLGVLEVTRRATVALAERISRTGTTDAFDENLEQAMNWFMIKASSYWFPSAESKYQEGLEELQAYLEKLNQGNATFYTRTDNLIPLLASFEDLLGSCDENLVKKFNEDGTPVSSFAVDNYFFYTQGVASAMATVLEAVHHDFLLTLESRNATELLHHAIVSCQQAAEIEPWLILNSEYNSVFANHRANMAAPISHAYFYIRVLIKTLST